MAIAPEDEKEFARLKSELRKIGNRLDAGKLPRVEKIESINRQMATLLCKHGLLPDGLKKYVQH